MLSIQQRSIVGSVLNVVIMKLTKGLSGVFCGRSIIIFNPNKFTHKSLTNQE